MKLTDFALIFLGITLPVIIVVYVNVSFTIKAVEQEIYYQKMIDSALKDATVKMKEVENDDPEVDYGYSGIINGKVSINATVAADTFFSSLANNFGIKGNDRAELYLKYFIPAFVIVDYNGVYISSMEEFIRNGVQVYDHTIKPKRYFSYTYAIDDKQNIITDIKKIEEISSKNRVSIHTIEFTMDDYVVHRGTINVGNKIQEYASKGFYLTDRDNNQELYDNNLGLQAIVENHLKNTRKLVIADVITRELTYTVNKHNHYARIAGIKYAFSFPATSKDEMYRYIEDIGALGLVQGLSIGNKYLNYKSYGGANITLANRYYLSIPNMTNNTSKYIRNLYHKDNKCPEYVISLKDNLVPQFVTSKQQAASLKATLKNSAGGSSFVQGFYPCPLCNP